MRKRILEVLLLTAFIAVAAGLFRSRSSVEPPRGAPPPSRVPTPARTPTPAPEATALPLVDPSEFSAIRKLLGPKYATARLGNLSPAAQVLFESGKLQVPQEGVWVDTSPILEAEGGCAIWIAREDEGETEHEFVQVVPRRKGPGWDLSAPATMRLPGAPNPFDLNYVAGMYAGRS